MATKGEKGVTTSKDKFTEWFTQIMLKADLADYSCVSGCIIIKPTAYAIWEKIHNEVDKRFKSIGLKNAYFPLLIPEKVLMREAKHLEGFAPEVAWVTQAGKSKLKERLAIRPTSETIMYDSYSKWIRSWRDLPLRLNQWNNVVRWEFKHPVPFLRTREFLWNEGHTAFADKKEAQTEEKQIIRIYKEVCEKYLALPSIYGQKSRKETFPGAEYTKTLEFFMPNGKAIQGPDFHHDGQIFAKAYDIKFLDKEGNEEYVYQNTFAITTRVLGILFAMHSDSKGLILPPKVAINKVVIIPILSNKDSKNILISTKKISSELRKFSPILDDREGYRPGFKFNEWELKGIPIRIEIGPRDVAKKQVVLVRRDTGNKKFVKWSNLSKTVQKELVDMQSNLFNRAKEFLDNSIVNVKSIAELKKVVNDKKIGVAHWCGSPESEEKIKIKTGAKSLNGIKSKGKCFDCGNECDWQFRFSKSY